MKTIKTLLIGVLFSTFAHANCELKTKLTEIVTGSTQSFTDFASGYRGFQNDTATNYWKIEKASMILTGVDYKVETAYCESTNKFKRFFRHHRIKTACTRLTERDAFLAQIKTLGSKEAALMKSRIDANAERIEELKTMTKDVKNAPAIPLLGLAVMLVSQINADMDGYIGAIAEWGTQTSASVDLMCGDNVKCIAHKWSVAQAELEWNPDLQNAIDSSNDAYTEAAAELLIAIDAIPCE